MITHHKKKNSKKHLNKCVEIKHQEAVEFMSNTYKTGWKDQKKGQIIINGKYANEWSKVLEIIQLAFTRGPIPKVFGLGTLVWSPKRVPCQFRGMALLEVVYKLVSTIINIWLTNNIEFHRAAHGFCHGKGTGTGIMEAKLRMKLAMRTINLLYMVLFLNLKKAYDTLD
jgi:hypothetical protein